MLETLNLIIKGVLIGIANVIPGVSGGTIILTLGLYEKLIKTINNFFKNIKENILFLAKLLIGSILGIIIISKILVKFLNIYPIQINIFFTGLILGGIPLILKNIKENKKHNYIIIIIFLILVLTSYLKPINQINITNLTTLNYLKLFIVGIIGAATMIIPGISGSFVLITLGYYEPILNTINKFIESFIGNESLIQNFLILLPFGLGIIVGFILTIKLIQHFLNKYKNQSYYAILGFIFGSIFLILKPLTNLKINTLTIISSLILGIIGYLISYKLGSGEKL